MNEISVTINGQQTKVDGDATLLALIEKHAPVNGPVAAILNEVIINRSDLGSTDVKEGDVIEVFMMLGGG